MVGFSHNPGLGKRWESKDLNFGNFHTAFTI